MEIDRQKLEEMGLSGECFWLIEYDIPSAIKNHHTKQISSKYTPEQAKFFRKLRNYAMFQLHFKIHATKNLFSSWFISENKLTEARKLAEYLKNALELAGFKEKAEKVRIIPILTNEEGAESLLERKVESLLQFTMEAIEKVDKGIHDKIMSESILWRCKKVAEAVEAIKEELTGNEAYNEICDTVEDLNDKIGQYESIKEAKKAKKA